MIITPQTGEKNVYISNELIACLNGVKQCIDNKVYFYWVMCFALTYAILSRLLGRSNITCITWTHRSSLLSGHAVQRALLAGISVGQC